MDKINRNDSCLSIPEIIFPQNYCNANYICMTKRMNLNKSIQVIFLHKYTPQKDIYILHKENDIILEPFIRIIHTKQKSIKQTHK